MGNPVNALSPLVKQFLNSMGNSRTVTSQTVAGLEFFLGLRPQTLGPVITQNAGRELAIVAIKIEAANLANEALQNHLTTEQIFAELNANLAGQTLFPSTPIAATPVLLARLEPETNDNFSVHNHIEQPGNNPIDP